MNPWTRPNQQEWSIVENRVKQICNPDIETICLAVSKYHYYGGPCDWNPIYNNEDTMREWAIWILTNADPDDIDELCNDYKDGKIPDALSLMDEYFN